MPSAPVANRPVSATGSATTTQAIATPVIEPDPTVQEHLGRLAKTKRHSIERAAELIELWKLSRRPDIRRDHVLLQSALYDATHRGVSTLDPIMDEFQVHPGAIAWALIPFHDTPDPRLHSFVWNSIACPRSDTFQASDRDPRVQVMLDYLSTRRADPPTDLVRNLFYAAPSAALIRLSLQWHDGSAAQINANWRRVAWADHLVQDVVWKSNMQVLKSEEKRAAEDELDQLSKSDEWWKRLYVAHILYRHDNIFDAAAIRKRLKKDSNPLVVEVINDKIQRGPPDTEKSWWQKLLMPK